MIAISIAVVAGWARFIGLTLILSLPMCIEGLSSIGITNLGSSVTRDTSAVPIAELTNQLLHIQFGIGCLADGLGSRNNRAIVAIVKTFEE